MDEQRVEDLTGEENQNDHEVGFLASATPVPLENETVFAADPQLLDQVRQFVQAGDCPKVPATDAGPHLAEIPPTPAAAAGGDALDELNRDELLERVRRQMGMLQKLKSRYDDRNNKCKSMADEIGQLETNLKSAHKQNDQLQVEVKVATATIAAGKSSKSLAAVEIEDYQRTIDLLEQRVALKQKGIDTLNDEMEQLRALNSDIQNEYAGVQAQNSVIKQQIEKERMQRAEIDAQLVQARNVQDSVRNEMATKFADVDELRGELEHEKFSKHKLTLRIAEVEDNLNRQISDAANNRQLYEKSCADADRLKEQLSRVEQEFKLYKLKAQRAVVENSQNSFSSVNNRNDRTVQLEAEVGELQLRFETEQRRLQRSHDSLATLKAENRMLKQQQTSKTGSVSSSEKNSTIDNHRAERDFDELLQQKDQQIRAASSTHADLSNENSRHKRQIDELSTQINSLKQKLYDATNRPQNSDQLTLRKARPSVDVSVQTDSSLSPLRLSPERISSQKPSQPQTFASRRNSNHSSTNHNVQANGYADRRVIYSRRSHNSTSTADGETDADIPNDDSKSSTSTLSQSASQVVTPAQRSQSDRQNYSVSSFEDLLLAPVTIQTSKTDYETTRVNCMNELLTDSQAMNRHLTTQITFLKDEVRRLEANAERLNHVHNMEYLKNVLMKFLIQNNSSGGGNVVSGGAEREHLVEVLATMLKLTKQERKALLTNTPVGSGGASANSSAGGGGEWTGLISRWTSVVKK